MAVGEYTRVGVVATDAGKYDRFFDLRVYQPDRIINLALNVKCARDAEAAARDLALWLSKNTAERVSIATDIINE